MGKTMKKALSLAMIAILVITSAPAAAFAVEAFSIGIVESSVTSNSATVALNNTTPGATYTAVISDIGSFDAVTKKLTGLKQNTNYSVTITESFTETSPTRFEVHKQGNKYYYMDNGSKVFVNISAVYHYHYGWVKDSGYDNDKTNYTDVYKVISNSSTATFKTKETPKLTLNVGTGGIAIIDGHTYPAGTHELYKSATPKNFSGKSYSNVGYTGGSTLGFVFEATGHTTWDVAFAPANNVYGLPYYDHVGFFSGLKASGLDDISGHDPKNDLLSADFSATVGQPVYNLGQQAVMTLVINNIDGDANTQKLNEVNVYANNDSSNDLLGGQNYIDGSKTITFNYTIPSTEAGLTGFTKGAVVNGKTIYTKVMNFDLVDRYHTTAGAAIIKSSTCTITVEVPLPIYPVTFNTVGGSPVPDTQNITSGGFAEEPSDVPTKEGYTFDYWTLNNEEYKFNIGVTEPITLVAHYTLIPVTTEPETTQPETTQPETTQPETTQPETTQPETTQPETTQPETTQPETTQPETTQPETTQPETTQPETTQPETTQPETTQPETTQPETTQPETTQPETTQPETTQPETTQPETTQPVTTQPTTEDDDEPEIINFIETTEASTETLLPEALPLGEASIFDFDSFQSSLATDTTESVEEIIIDEEETPLADALPQTGQLPAELFYGIGGLISAAGVFLKRKR